MASGIWHRRMKKDEMNYEEGITNVNLRNNIGKLEILGTLECNSCNKGSKFKSTYYENHGLQKYACENCGAKYLIVTNLSVIAFETPEHLKRK